VEAVYDVRRKAPIFLTFEKEKAFRKNQFRNYYDDQFATTIWCHEPTLVHSHYFSRCTILTSVEWGVLSSMPRTGLHYNLHKRQKECSNGKKNCLQGDRYHLWTINKAL